MKWWTVTLALIVIVAAIAVVCWEFHAALGGWPAPPMGVHAPRGAR